MSRYDNYFNELKKHNDNQYSAGSNLNPDKIELTNDIHNQDYYANLHYTDTHNSNIRRNNDKVGGVELLDRREPILPISAYLSKTVPAELKQHIKSANQKQAEKDRVNALLFGQGFGINPTTGKSTNTSHSLHHNNNHNPIRVNPKTGINTNDKLLQDLVNDGLATVNTQQHTINKPVIKKSKIVGEKSIQEYNKLGMDAQLDYDKKMATIYRDKGMGTYKPPPIITRRPMPEPAPKPKPLVKKSIIPVDSGELPSPPPPDSSGGIF